MRTSPRLLLDTLKNCPLCEAVNAESSLSCVVCGWAGAFEQDADGLQASLAALVAQCPDLATVPRRLGWRERLRRMLRTPLWQAA